MFDTLVFMIEAFVEQRMGHTVAQLDDELRQIELEHRALEARRAALLAVAESRSVHAVDGHHSIRNYVRATCNSSRPETTRQVRLARLINALPVVGDAVAAGRIGVAQAGELARVFANPRVGHLLPGVVDALLDHAEHLPFDDFKVCVDRWIMLADLDGAFRDMAADVEARTATVVAVGSTLDVRATGGDALTAAKMIGVFERFVRAEFDKDVAARRERFGIEADRHSLPRSAAQRKFDALEAIFEAAIAAPSGGRAPEPVVNIVADAATVDEAFTRAGLLLPNGNQLDLGDLEPDEVKRLVDELTADPSTLLDRRCETESGIPVHPVLVLQAALTGHVRRVVVDSDGVVIDMGHKQRLYAGSPRVAASLLVRHCSHAGCDVPAALADIDHMDEWVADGGATDQRNADVRCGKHDRFKHRERWRSRRAPGGRVYSIRPDDTIVLPVGERPPDLSIDEVRRIVRRRVRNLRRATIDR